MTCAALISPVPRARVSTEVLGEGGFDQHAPSVFSWGWSKNSCQLGKI